MGFNYSREILAKHTLLIQYLVLFVQLALTMRTSDNQELEIQTNKYPKDIQV